MEGYTLASMRLHDLVKIRWQDSCSSAAWHSPDKSPYFGDDDILVDTVGLVVAFDERTVTLAQSWGVTPDHEYGNLWCLPIGMIVGITLLQMGAITKCG